MDECLRVNEIRVQDGVFLIHNPFVDLEGWLSLVVGLGLVGFLCVWYQW